jgi:hypothetical protein
MQGFMDGKKACEKMIDALELEPGLFRYPKLTCYLTLFICRNSPATLVVTDAFVYPKTILLAYTFFLFTIVVL